MRADFKTDASADAALIQIDNTPVWEGKITLRVGPGCSLGALDHKHKVMVEGEREVCVLTCPFCKAEEIVGPSFCAEDDENPDHKRVTTPVWASMKHPANCFGGLWTRGIRLTPGVARAIASALMGAAAESKENARP